MQRRGQIAINFHRVQVIQPANEWLGNRTSTRPDFHHDIVAFSSDGTDNARNVMTIRQKVLAESFPGAWQHRYRRRAN